MIVDLTMGGSPPRPWGQCGGASPPGHRARFTPTPVGTISSVRALGLRTTVHPHARGDNELLAQELPIPIGSPPRPWGQ